MHASVGSAKVGAREVRNAGSETNAGSWSSITSRYIMLVGNLLRICTTEALEGGGSSSSQACGVTAQRIPEEVVGSLLIFLRLSLHFTRLYHKNDSPHTSVARIFKHRGYAANEG